MKRLILALLTGAALAASLPSALAAVKTIVLVHGAFADGSGWKPVADILVSHGYSVRVVQEPETAFDADVAATRRVLDKAGPCVLVGHSYGGMIITEAGKHPDVKARVYVAAGTPSTIGSARAIQWRGSVMFTTGPITVKSSRVWDPVLLLRPAGGNGAFAAGDRRAHNAPETLSARAR